MLRLLVALACLAVAPLALAAGNQPTRVGPLRTLSPTSVSVGPVTCTRTTPLSLSAFHLGQIVRIECRRGALVQIRDDFFVGVKATGRLTKLGPSSLTVLGAECRRTVASPGLDAYHVGDWVSIECGEGQMLETISKAALRQRAGVMLFTTR